MNYKYGVYLCEFAESNLEFVRNSLWRIFNLVDARSGYFINTVEFHQVEKTNAFIVESDTRHAGTAVDDVERKTFFLDSVIVGSHNDRFSSYTYTNSPT